MDLESLTHAVSSDQKIIHLILDAINSGIIILDEKTKIIFANSKARSLLGVDQEIIGLKFKDLFLKEDQEILSTNIIKLSDLQGEFEGEVLLKRGEKDKFMALLSVSLWKLDGNKAYVVTINDLTRLKGVERVLKKSERMVYLGRMLDDISHQIRNPVLAIGGFARRLLKTNVERPEYVRIIMDEARRLEILLDELTDFIQLPKPRFSIYKSSDIIEFVAKVSGDTARIFNTDVKFDSSIPNDISIVTDLVLLKRAIEPVIQNACESFYEVKRPQEIKISFEKGHSRKKELKIIVKDFGCGIRPPLMERIFHPFFTTKTGHIGMGLTFTKRIIEELEGTVEIESTFNKGTKVSLLIPGDRRRPIRTRPI